MRLDLSSASVREIADFYSNVSFNSDGSYLRANMVMSTDGHLTDGTGSSRGLSSELDLKVLLTLRAISDVVLVGASTAQIEDYRPPVLAGEFVVLNTKNPKLAIISSSLNFTPSARLFSRPENMPIIFTVESTTEMWRANYARLAELADIQIFNGEVNLPEVKKRLIDQGLNQIVCEGGESLLSQLFELNLVDELDLTLSPVTVGPDAETNCVTQMQSEWSLISSAALGQHELTRYVR